MAKRPVSEKVQKQERIAALAYWSMKIAKAAEAAIEGGSMTYGDVLWDVKQTAMKLDPSIRSSSIAKAESIVAPTSDNPEPRLMSTTKISCQTDADCPEGYFCGQYQTCHPLYEAD